MDMESSAIDISKDEEMLRCTCNKLICVIKDDTIEIKCNKCKRITSIKTKGILETVTK